MTSESLSAMIRTNAFQNQTKKQKSTSVIGLDFTFYEIAAASEYLYQRGCITFHVNSESTVYTLIHRSGMAIPRR